MDSFKGDEAWILAHVISASPYDRSKSFLVLLVRQMLRDWIADDCPLLFECEEEQQEYQQFKKEQST